MEKYFKPVHCPPATNEIRPQRNHRSHHHRDSPSHRYTKLEDSDRENHRYHSHSHHLQGIPQHKAHYSHSHIHSEEDEILYDHDTPVTLSRASSSSLSSSSSASSSSWYTEASVNDPFSLRQAERPQHSLSCSNIPDVQIGFRKDDNSEPIVCATIKHSKKDSICSESHASSQPQGKHEFSALDRSHSRSDEGPLQSERGRAQCRTRHTSGALYKSSSLNRNLAFNEDDMHLRVSVVPKRAMSSSQLPSKGILKNKERETDIRKVKSMEVLSHRVLPGPTQSGQTDKGPSQAEIKQARETFVQGKIQFSAFLNEITKQVISPSQLTILGVNNNNKTTGKTVIALKSDPVKPELPPKKHKEGAVNMTQSKRAVRQEKAGGSSWNISDDSNPDKLISYPVKNHHGSPPPHHYPHTGEQNSPHRSRKDRRQSPTRGATAGARETRFVSQLTDETSTSPESVQPKRHHRKQTPGTFQLQQHGARSGNGSPPSSAQGAGQGVGSESSSSKSDSSRTRDTGSTTNSHSSEPVGRHQSHAGYPPQNRNLLCDADHLRALQEENNDLQQNLVQTVVCIESLEAELQRTREELGHVKEKYKSLLQTHTGTKQANSLLGEHLHIASESLSSERKFLLNRVSQLSSELEEAHRTIAALENVNVPSLIKELLEKHFDSPEAVDNFLTASVANSMSAVSPHGDSQPSHHWLTQSDAAPPRTTAFLPFKQPTAQILSAEKGSSHSAPLSVADISTAIYNKMAASYAARPKPLYPQSHLTPQSTNHTHSSPGGTTMASDCWGGGEGSNESLLEKNLEVNAISAQQILDGFLQQLQDQSEAGGGTERPGGHGW